MAILDGYQIGDLLYCPSRKCVGWIKDDLNSGWWRIEWADGDQENLTDWNLAQYKKELNRLKRKTK